MSTAASAAGQSVPEVLLSDATRPSAVAAPRALGRTAERRPDLLADRALTQEELALLAEYRRGQAQQQ